jgi:molybdopterin-synthase adenylyltransferase
VAYHNTHAYMAASVHPAVDYSRTQQTSFPRDRVRQLRVVLVGAGAIGNEVAKTLGLLGCGEVLIVDPDQIEPHNLTRSVLFRTGDWAGSNKASSLANACRHYFPDTAWTAMETEIADAGSQPIAQSDLVFSCVDNDLARLEIAWLCAKFDRPLVDAGLGAENYSKIRVSLFPGRDAASFCCLLPPARRRELLSFWDCRRSPCQLEPQNEAVYPGTPMAAAMAGSMQVDLALRLVLLPPSGGRPVARSFEFTLDPPTLAVFDLSRALSCPFHDGLPEVSILAPAGSHTTAGELLDRAHAQGSGDPALVLDWPLCIRAKCRDCGVDWDPIIRLALFRRSAACPSCRSRRVAPVRTIHRITRFSPFSSWPLEALGMPDRHFYTIEFSEGPTA